MINTFSVLVVLALSCITVTALNDIQQGNISHCLLRVFKPLSSKGDRFYKAVDIGAPICPSHYQEYDNIAVKPSSKHPGTFIVPFTHMIADNVRCGKTGSETEYMWMIPAKNLEDARSAEIGGLTDVYDIKENNGRFKNASQLVMSMSPETYVAVDMEDRYCGETLMWEKHSLHLLVSSAELIFNFGAFGWIGKKESGIISFHPPVNGQSDLCIYKDSNDPGKNSTGFPPEKVIEDESSLPDNSPIPSPAPFAPGPLASPSPNAFSMVPLSDFNNATAVNDVESDDDESVCFPADSQVEMESGLFQRMDELSIGDRIRVGPSEYSEIFMFTHKVLDGVQRGFRNIVVEAGDSITATAGHYIVVNDGFQTARSVKVGDLLTLASGKQSPVTAVESIQKNGLYNPQTQDGRIIVDGIIASTYTTAVHPAAAHGMLAPLRFLYQLGLLRHFDLFHDGYYGLDALAPSGIEKH